MNLGFLLKCILILSIPVFATFLNFFSHVQSNFKKINRSYEEM